MYDRETFLVEVSFDDVTLRPSIIFARVCESLGWRAGPVDVDVRGCFASC
jgi:hypothetical protein